MTDRPLNGDPDSEGLGEEAGPDFAPPGAGPSYGPPSGPPTPTPAQPPGSSPLAPPPGSYPPAAAPADSFPPPSGPPRAVGFASPPEQPPSGPSRGVIITLVSVVAAVLIITGGVVVIGNAMNSTRGGPSDPWSTPPREKTPPLPTKPEQQQGTGFTFTSPAGWTRAPEWGDKNDGKIIDAAGNDITVYVLAGSTPEKLCQEQLRDLEIWVPGVITDLPDRKIDGQVAPGGQLAGEDTYRMRCVQSKGTLFNISLQSDPNDIDVTDQALNSVLDSWQWT
ncbi:hypothetical protein [Microlunatus speluncae]|uniref:hypothetical protein n=1 Tax=Microlunatus speluncae TaxID=2594267 RepID=UPI0012667461|nr:hypothetical protein [Microlunatus speluncae]